MNNMIVSVSGFGFSGSGAVIDFLKEFSEISMVENVESKILYYPDGILNLYQKLIIVPVYLNSDVAIKRFYCLVKKIISNKSSNKAFPGLTKEEVLRITKTYLDSLVQCEWKGSIDSTNITLFNTTFKRFTKLLLRAIRRITGFEIPWLFYNCAISVNSPDFIIKTEEYLKQLYMNSFQNARFLLLDQFFPASNYKIPMELYKNSKLIIVDRDPRDVFLFCKYKMKHSVGFIPTSSVYEFIQWYKTIREVRKNSLNERVILIHFEDLIYNYDKTTQFIISFLGLEDCVRREKLFVPSISIKNTQLFKMNSSYASEVKPIEEELTEYLYNFPE